MKSSCSPRRQDRLRRVVPGDAGDRSATLGAGPGQEDARQPGRDTPGLGRGVEVGATAGPRPLQVAVEDVAAGQVELRLELLGDLGLDARAAEQVARDDALDRVEEEL